MVFANARCCDYRGEKLQCIQVKNGRIQNIAPNLESLTLEENEEVINADSKLLMPAFIDLNIYPKARTLSRKSLSTLSLKALRGGFSTLLLLPQTSPTIDSEAIIELVKSIDSTLEAHILPSIKPTFIDSERVKLTDISKLYTAGAQAIAFESDIEGNLLLRISQYAKMLKIPLICFAQNASLAQGVVSEGEFASRLGLPSISEKAQNIEVVKMCEMLLGSEVEVVFSALSEPRSLEIVNQYKAQGLRAHAEVSLHHLILNESACEDYNTAGKINPPLLCESKRLELLDALQNDKIDVLTSLQCADFNSQKDQVFELASFGIDSIAYGFSLAYSKLVKPNILNLSTLSRFFSHNPAKILGLENGSLEVGKKADFMIIDTESSVRVDDTFSPYNGETLSGRVSALYADSKLHTLE
ncbi:dihydroorotase [Helicobacter sp. MIT 00-7814]|uniref:amidohydrolase family protein n=1 Tax=unclassified Helicobacter TaxID=2593540 RepID=UPI000E1F1F1A|nr:MULTISPECIES: amidohydrolase family protein [unclassified Helicobacter]RDU55032.1 dihydroorotase [Helicobacter sp. MIT 00-7814]RDU55937.1 dihydroorotase [Helicobacter sp. MIT 99-10781]